MGGVYIDDPDNGGSDPGAWADALRFPPYVEDSGRDGPDILSELARVRCIFQLRSIAAVIGVSPDMAAQLALNPLEGGADSDASAFVPDSLSTHANGDTDV